VANQLFLLVDFLFFVVVVVLDSQKLLTSQITGDAPSIVLSQFLSFNSQLLFILSVEHPSSSSLLLATINVIAIVVIITGTTTIGWRCALH